MWKVFLQKLRVRHLPGNGVDIFGIKCPTISSTSWEWCQLHLPLMQKYATKTTFSICIGLTVWFPQNMHGHLYRYFCHFYWKWPISLIELEILTLSLSLSLSLSLPLSLLSLPLSPSLSLSLPLSPCLSSLSLPLSLSLSLSLSVCHFIPSFWNNSATVREGVTKFEMPRQKLLNKCLFLFIAPFDLWPK